MKQDLAAAAALSVLELVRLPQEPVEAVIALSILFLARELTMAEERRSALTRGRPWIMGLLFGPDAGPLGWQARDRVSMVTRSLALGTGP